MRQHTKLLHRLVLTITSHSPCGLKSSYCFLYGLDLTRSTSQWDSHCKAPPIQLAASSKCQQKLPLCFFIFHKVFHLLFTSLVRVSDASTMLKYQWGKPAFLRSQSSSKTETELESRSGKEVIIEQAKATLGCAEHITHLVSSHCHSQMMSQSHEENETQKGKGTWSMA